MTSELVTIISVWNELTLFKYNILTNVQPKNLFRQEKLKLVDCAPAVNLVAGCRKQSTIHSCLLCLQTAQTKTRTAWKWRFYLKNSA